MNSSGKMYGNVRNFASGKRKIYGNEDKRNSKELASWFYFSMRDTI